MKNIFLSTLLFSQIICAQNISHYGYKLLSAKDPIAVTIKNISSKMQESNISTGKTQVTAWHWSSAILKNSNRMVQAQEQALRNSVEQNLGNIDNETVKLNISASNVHLFTTNDIQQIAKQIALGNAFSPKNKTDLQIAMTQTSAAIKSISDKSDPLMTVITPAQVVTTDSENGEDSKQAFITSVTNIKTGNCASFLIFEGTM